MNPRQPATDGSVQDPDDRRDPEGIDPPPPADSEDEPDVDLPGPNDEDTGAEPPVNPDTP